MDFQEKLLDAARRNRSWVCVGLDPDPDLLPQTDLLSFNKAIIDATADLVCAYKPNLAFYEALGLEGLDSLKKTVEYVPRHVPVIGDGKRGDIGNTAKAYARALFSVFGFDAVTLNPYLGFDSIEPFLGYAGKGVFLLCKTSNPGSADIQELACVAAKDGKSADVGTAPLFEVVARKAREWNSKGNIGLVVGATYPEQLKKVRELCPDMLLLIPGIGAQGGDLPLTVRYGVDARGEKAVINSSRQILYASKGKDFATAARNAANTLREQINDLLPGNSG